MQARSEEYKFITLKKYALFSIKKGAAQGRSENVFRLFLKPASRPTIPFGGRCSTQRQVATSEGPYTLRHRTMKGSWTACGIISTHSYQIMPEAGECYKIYAKYFYDVQQYQNAIDYALKSSEIFDRMKLPRDQVEALQVAADAYDLLGDTRTSNGILKQCNQILLENHEGR
jgi:hypothetical protein